MDAGDFILVEALFQNEYEFSVSFVGMSPY